MNNKNWDKGLEAIEYMKKNSKYKWFIMTSEIIEQESFQTFNIPIIDVNKVGVTKEQKKFLKNPLQRIPSIWWLLKNMKLMLGGQIRLFESVAYTEDGKSFRARTNVYINKNWNKFQGWSCDIGLNSVFVNWDGTVQGSCGQTIYGLDYSYNILDTFFTTKFNPELKPSICSKKTCYCSPETHISKFKLS